MLTDPAEADTKRASRFRVMVSEGEARASFSWLEMLPTSAGVRRCSSASGDVAGRFREAVGVSIVVGGRAAACDEDMLKLTADWLNKTYLDISDS